MKVSTTPQVKPILAIDMDEVIADSISLLIKQYNKEHQANLSKELLWGKTIYDCLPESHIALMKAYQNSADFYQRVSLVEGAKEGIAILAKQYDIYILSAALEFPNSLAARCAFIEQHFPELSWKKVIFSANKPLIKADFIVDDMVENLKGFGDRGFLFTAYHNANVEYPYRVSSWNECVEKLI